MRKQIKKDAYEVNWKDTTLTIDTNDLQEMTRVIIKGNHLEKPISLTLPTKTAAKSAMKPKVPTGTTVPVAAAAAGREDNNQEANNDNIAIQLEHNDTNSGIINKSQFLDGGMGDIGMQWAKVKLYKSTIINN